MKYDAHTEVSDNDRKSKPSKRMSNRKVVSPTRVSDLSDPELLSKMKKYTTSWYDYWYRFIEGADQQY